MKLEWYPQQRWLADFGSFGAVVWQQSEGYRWIAQGPSGDFTDLGSAKTLEAAQDAARQAVLAAYIARYGEPPSGGDL